MTREQLEDIVAHLTDRQSVSDGQTALAMLGAKAALGVLVGLVAPAACELVETERDALAGELAGLNGTLLALCDALTSVQSRQQIVMTFLAPPVQTPDASAQEQA